MAQFTSYDGTKLAFRRAGAGRPLVCLPGGPGRTPGYLGDLGGLGGGRELILPDTRGTGESAVPADPATYRCDRLARDVEALRAELGLERIDLLGHSAGGNVALRYAAAYPERIGHLVLLSPGPQSLGLDFTEAQQQAAMRRRSAEPWYQEAQAAIQAAEAGDDSAETRLGYLPFFYGRWDDAARAHAQVGFSERPGRCRPVSTRRERSTRRPPGPGWLRSPHRSWCMRAKSRSAPPPNSPPRRPGSSPAGNSRSNPAQVTTRGWMIPPGSRPGCWPSWADPPGPASRPVQRPGSCHRRATPAAARSPCAYPARATGARTAGSSGLRPMAARDSSSGASTSTDPAPAPG